MAAFQKRQFLCETAELEFMRRFNIIPQSNASDEVSCDP